MLRRVCPSTDNEPQKLSDTIVNEPDPSIRGVRSFSKEESRQQRNGKTGSAEDTTPATRQDVDITRPSLSPRSSGRQVQSQSSTQHVQSKHSLSWLEESQHILNAGGYDPTLTADAIGEGDTMPSRQQILRRLPSQTARSEPDQELGDSEEANGDDGTDQIAGTVARPLGRSSSDVHLSMRDLYEDGGATSPSRQIQYNYSFSLDDFAIDSLNSKVDLPTMPAGSPLHRQQSSGSVDTPPSSLHAPAKDVIKRWQEQRKQQYESPPDHVVSISAATNVPPPNQIQELESSQATPESSVASSHTTTTSARSRPMQLYSAFGSLEDAMSHSFQGKTNQTVKKFEFRSVQFLPPVNQIQRKGRTSNASARRRLLGTTAASATLLADSRHDVNTAGDLMRPTQPPTTIEENKPRKPSNLRKSGGSGGTDDKNRKVTIAAGSKGSSPKKRNKKAAAGPVEMFRPSSDAYTPRMGKKYLKYKPAEERQPVQQMASPMGSLQRPNFRDALRRVAMILHQHIVKIEQRFDDGMLAMVPKTTVTSNKKSSRSDGLFMQSMKNEFSEERFVTPTYRCTLVRVPMARPGMVFGLKKLRQEYKIPTEQEIYEFAHQLFKSVQLSSECSIVCLIYVERLMEVAKVPLLASTWRPIFMCGLLLASKVWQDLSSWNIEFASVYPQFPLESINRLELLFLRCVKWDLYISSSAYAKYYFALRSLVEKPDFRQRYNRMVGGVHNVQASEALKIEKRTVQVKEEALLQLSHSM